MVMITLDDDVDDDNNYENYNYNFYKMKTRFLRSFIFFQYKID